MCYKLLITCEHNQPFIGRNPTDIWCAIEQAENARKQLLSKKNLEYNRVLPECNPEPIDCRPFFNPLCDQCGPKDVVEDLLVQRYLDPIQMVFDHNKLGESPFSLWGFCFMNDKHYDPEKLTWEGLHTVERNFDTLLRNSVSGSNDSWSKQLTLFHAVKVIAQLFDGEQELDEYWRAKNPLWWVEFAIMEGMKYLEKEWKETGKKNLERQLRKMRCDIEGETEIEKKNIAKHLVRKVFATLISERGMLETEIGKSNRVLEAAKEDAPRRAAAKKESEERETQRRRDIAAAAKQYADEIRRRQK